MSSPTQLEPRSGGRAAASGPPDGSSRIALYTRIVRASLERVWENVLDWEHLPWLHREAFCKVEPLAADEAGWEAVVEAPARAARRRLRISVDLDRPRLRYVTRTLEGPGAGTEIWTQLARRSERETGIEVGFFVPGVGPGAAEALGRSYVALYTTLWDQDEAMMVERQRVLDARAARGGAHLASSAALGPASTLLAGGPRIVDAFGGRWRIVARGSALVVHDAVCPHLGGPLASALPDEQGCVTCPWHGYRFDVATGRSADGRGFALSRAPELRIDPETGEASLVRVR
ncbi:MAG TPA: Rieske (2Fe-2S) protein [Myxococcota bacterium]|nr:Rieske (2Fe-2S) protein [Myxococcota bacterium]